MPTDEVSQGGSAAQPRVRTGPRHAAPKKPLAARLHVPAGKAIAFAAMPTAVLMGIGLTPTLANADDQPSTSKSLTAEEYQACVELLDGTEDGKDASPSATPSDSASPSESADKAEPSPSATASSGEDDTPSPDSGSDDEAEPAPSASASKTTETTTSGADAATPTPSASETSSNPLDPLGVGEALEDILTPDETGTATPTPSATASASTGTSGTDTSGSDTSDAVKDAADKAAEAATDTAKDTTGTTSEAAEDSTEATDEVTSSASPSPSPSASASTDAADCPISTDDEGNVDNPAILPDDPWYLNASSLWLKGADYQGVVKVRTANGTVKKVLKYVISGGTDIGDLHQTVIDKRAGVTYHVQADKGTTSTITDGDTVMYTESISGNLFGLIPITFDPEHPPPLNIPLIYFTNVKVVQAGQFGGTLTVPGMSTYQTEG